MKVLIAFDQATQISGYSIWNIETKELIKWGTLKATKGKATQRINTMKYQIEELLSEYKPQIVLGDLYIVLEDIQYQENKEKEGAKIEFGKPAFQGGTNVKTFKTLAWLQGVLLDWCYERNVHTELFYSSTWKSFCEIKGFSRAAQKAQSIEFVKNKFNINPTTDEADAICLGWMAVHDINKKTGVEI